MAEVKTIKVQSSELGGEVTINEADFNPDIHTKVEDAKKPQRVKVSPDALAAAQSPAPAAPVLGVGNAAKTAGVKAEQGKSGDEARGKAQS